MSTTDPRTENFPLAAESREAIEAALREQRALTPTERVIASVEAYTPQEAAERTLANEMLADTRPDLLPRADAYDQVLRHRLDGAEA